MLVEFKLTRGAGDDGQVVALFNAVLPQQGKDALQDLCAAKLLLNRQQADFADLASGGKVRVELVEFVIERERPVAARGQHAGQLPARQTDQVGVLRVEL